MHDRHQIFDHLALGREPLIVEHQDLAPVPGREAVEPWISEAGEPVPVRDDEVTGLAPFDPIHEVEELRTPEVQAAADLLDPAHFDETSRRAEVAENAPLVQQIGFLRGARHPAINEGSCVRHFLLGTDAEEGVHIGLGVPTPPRRGPPRCRQTAHTVEALQRLDVYASSRSSLRKCEHPSTHAHIRSQKRRQSQAPSAHRIKRGRCHAATAVSRRCYAHRTSSALL